MIIGFEAKKVFENRSGLGNYSRNTINLLAKYYPENQYKLFAQKALNRSIDMAQQKKCFPG